MSIDVGRDAAGIVTILLNRPEKRNAMTMGMYRDFGTALTELDADDSVRCIVVRGAGNAFCAGSDIGGFDDERNGREQAREYAKFTLAMTDCLRDSRHPTVACIEGVCVGGGLEIAAMCDIRIAGRGSRFGIPVNRIGLTVDHHELADLIAVVGPTVTLEILLEGRVFGAEEALDKGLLTRMVEDDAVSVSAYEAAQAIARGAPLVNRWHKKFVRQLREMQRLNEAELDEAYACFDTEDYRTGTAAFSRKEKPVFSGR
ncbi:MAG: enoyl-CoA hydratase-related protein [Pseudomonadota bacterium]